MDCKTRDLNAKEDIPVGTMAVDEQRIYYSRQDILRIGRQAQHRDFSQAAFLQDLKDSASDLLREQVRVHLAGEQQDSVAKAPTICRSTSKGAPPLDQKDLPFVDNSSSGCSSSCTAAGSPLLSPKVEPVTCNEGLDHDDFLSSCSEVSSDEEDDPLVADLMNHIKEKGAWNLLSLLSRHVVLVLSGKKQLDIAPFLLIRPVAVTVMQNGHVVCAESQGQTVRMFSGTGNYVKRIQCEVPFKSPTSLLTLSSGRLVVLDEASFYCFDSQGETLRLGSSRFSRLCGLAEDEEGLVLTINENKSHRPTAVNPVTSPGTADLLFFNLEKRQLVKKMALTPFIQDPKRSECRFVSQRNGRIFVTDKGLDCVYIIDVRLKQLVGRVSSPDLIKPTNAAVDDLGNFILASQRTGELFLFNSSLQLVCKVELSPPVQNPCCLYLDSDKSQLYVLSRTLVRYQLRAGPSAHSPPIARLNGS